MFSGITILSDGLRIIATNTLLTINSVQREDEGSYSCVVTNEYGSQQSSATLSIGTIIVPSLAICLCVATVFITLRVKAFASFS